VKVSDLGPSPFPVRLGTNPLIGQKNMIALAERLIDLAKLHGSAVLLL
jgi:hypothetical protein